MRTHTGRSRRRRRIVIALVLTAGLVTLFAVRSSSATEIIPSVGLSRPVDGNADSRVYTGLAIRSALAPVVNGEIGVAYRNESRFNDQLHVRSWPITASLYFAPGPVYAGAGVGWYQTSFSYPDGSPFADETRQDFGVHVGGGVELPLSPGAGVDLNGRYVMMQDQESRLVPEQFNPDFWTMSLGLALKF